VNCNEIIKIMLTLWVVGFMLSIKKHSSLYLNLPLWLKWVLFLKNSPYKVWVLAIVWQGWVYLMSISLAIVYLFFKDIYNVYCLLLDNFIVALILTIFVIGMIDAVITDRNEELLKNMQYLVKKKTVIGLVLDKVNHLFSRMIKKEKYDYFIVTDELILARFENKEWQEFELRNYYSHETLKTYVDIFKDRKLISKVIMAINKATGYSFLSKVFGEEKYAMVLFGFGVNAESRINAIDNALYHRMHYSTIANVEIGLVVAATSVVNEKSQPIIVVSAIRNHTEYSLFFAGTIVIKRHYKGELKNEFDDFCLECIKKREESFSEYVDTSDFSAEDLEELNEKWRNNSEFIIIMASNNTESSQVIYNTITFDSYVNFTEVTDAIPRLIEVTFTGKKDIIL